MKSVGYPRKSAYERADAIPHNLHANTNQEKRREPQDDAHAALAHGGGQAVGKAVANINADCDESGTDHCLKDREQIVPEMVRQVSPKSDSHGNRAGTHRKRQGQGIERITENVRQIDFFLYVMSPIGLFFLIQHGPPIGNHHEAAADLHHRNGDAEEVQNVRPNEKRRDKQDETVHSHLARQCPSRRSWIING